VIADVLVAAGALVIAGAGAVARCSGTGLLYPAGMVGIGIVLLGFARAGTIRK